MADEAVVQARARAACVALAAVVAADTYPAVARGMLSRILSGSSAAAGDDALGECIARTVVLQPVALELTQTGVLVFPSAASELPHAACDRRPVIRALVHIVRAGAAYCFAHAARGPSGELLHAVGCLVAQHVAAAAPRALMLDVAGALVPRILAQTGARHSAHAVLRAVYREALRDPLVALAQQGRLHDPDAYARYYVSAADGPSAASTPASPVATPTTPLVSPTSPPPCPEEALRIARDVVSWADCQYLGNAMPHGVTSFMMLHQLGTGVGRFLSRAVCDAAPSVCAAVDRYAAPLAALAARLAAVPVGACMQCRVLCHSLRLPHTPAHAWQGLPPPYGELRPHPGQYPPLDAHTIACTRACDIPALPTCFLAVLLARHLNAGGARRAWVGTEYAFHGAEVVYVAPRAIERLARTRDAECARNVAQFTAVRDAYWLTISVPPPDLMPSDILACTDGSDIRLSLLASVLAALWPDEVPFVRFS